MRCIMGCLKVSENKNNKTNIWIYAVVLFTSAFIVLMLTALSQIKFNKYINDYKYQIFTKEDEKNRFKSNLNLALEENVRLKAEVEFLKDEISDLNKKLKETEDEQDKLKEDYNNIINTYKVLLTAQKEYEKGNYIGCAEMLAGDIKPDMLDDQSRERYQFLVDNTYKKAAYEFYKQGYKYFKQKIYPDAEMMFSKSLIFADNEYFSDDSCYFLAIIAYKNGDKESARSHIGKLLSKYPKSNYVDEAKELFNLLEV